VKRRGLALIVVLWLMAVLTLLMYAFLAEMQVEYALAGNFGDEKKAEQLAWSAVELGCATVLNDLQPWQELEGAWSHDDLGFFEFPLGDGAITLFHPTFEEDGRMRWGLEDEASKINLNAAPKDVLLRLPGVTEEIADSVIDWRDQDSNPGPNGAEDAYYQTLDPPYRCKNQPFETVEELLFIRGMTPEILYGKDANLNGRFEKGEVEGSNRPDPALYMLVTVHSVDRNASLDEQPRVNLNTGTPDQLLAAGLNPGEVQAVVTARLAGSGFPSVAHLLGNPDQGIPPVLTRDRYKAVVDRLSVVDGETVPGLVNVNTAPRQVLITLPGITEEVAVKIIGQRTSTQADLSNVGWLVDVVEPPVLQRFASLVTVRSFQFRINAVGRVGTPYGGGAAPERPGAFKRMVAVFDKLAAPAPRIVYWKDMTRFGMPYDPSEGPDQRP
jgi:type II secretory pathway component PulK